MNLNVFDNLYMDLSSCINSLAIVSRAIATTETASGNLNYVIIGLVVVIIILIIITLKGNKKK